MARYGWNMRVSNFHIPCRVKLSNAYWTGNETSVDGRIVSYAKAGGQYHVLVHAGQKKEVNALIVKWLPIYPLYGIRSWVSRVPRSASRPSPMTRCSSHDTRHADCITTTTVRRKAPIAVSVSMIIQRDAASNDDGVGATTDQMHQTAAWMPEARLRTDQF
jgi:hypothetical protein